MVKSANKLHTALRYVLAAVLVMLSAAVGMGAFHVLFADSAPVDRSSQRQSQRETREIENFQQTALAKIEYVTPLLPMNERVSLCLDNPTHCPMYPEGQLEKDWPLRHAKKSHAACYFEFKNMNPSCPKACDDIFFVNAHSPDLGTRVAQACKIGCNYAIQAKQDAKETCLFNCKNTVWGNNKNNVRCNRQNGLGLELPASASLSVGKACEFGCILGNERLCPWCDERSRPGTIEGHV